MNVSNHWLNLDWSTKLDTQTQMRLNQTVLDVMVVEHLLKEDKIGKVKALKDLNKAFDALVEIRDANPDEPIHAYVERVFDRIADLTMH